ncbi:hypothetical protein HanHA300_Chr04g0125991 [Helianthus annuus]|nr:hypothetical protein HanHA300_Chr04g0125991 [Helianthus annuus]KAJ0596085.1 hypothetical protein HanHA89_Chr04g0138781 [Helianthus annuus]KAJ0756736.1 hypothetical protein HanLR1_Chr04g0130531 [Helianthus annuus]
MLKTEIKIESSGVMDKLQKEKGCKPTRFSCFILIIMYKQVKSWVLLVSCFYRVAWFQALCSLHIVTLLQYCAECRYSLTLMLLL